VQQIPAPVDSVEFLVLVDNSLDSLSSVPKHVSLEWPRLMRHGMKELSGEAQCCANHGLSLVVTARRGGVSHTVMFDAGPENYVLERNAPRLGVDFRRLKESFFAWSLGPRGRTPCGYSFHCFSWWRVA
jgi:7,8-dihydropterin-6-yl-methyl-4-(beta-D-ribofuranosyl)aminobenzene 5'-phosphate synthase